MNANQKRRLEKIEKLVAPPSASAPSGVFRLVDMVSWPLEAQREYETGDEATRDALLERYEGIPRPVPSTRKRRWSTRRTPRIDTLIVSAILDDPEPFEDEPDTRRRDGLTVPGGPQGAPALDPHEIVGDDPFGYPETRAARTARLTAEAAQSTYTAFGMDGRPR